MRKPFAILFLSFIPLICTAASEPAHIPIAADAVPYSEPLQNIPAGAREFEVLPPAGGQTIVRGEDFGITGNCENFSQKLQAAIDSCKKLGASKLVLKKGIYRIIENDTIKFEKLENFTFCGGGSTLVFRKKSGSLFDIRNCERVEFKNFNVDWDWDADPLGAVAKIVKIEQSAFLQNVDFKFVDYEGRTYPNRQCLLRNVARIDPSTRSAGVEGGQNFGWEMFGKPKYKKQWIDGNTIRITLPAKSRLNVGEFYRINHYYYDMPCFFMRSNRHIAMRDINIYSCAGMGIIVFGTQQYFSLQNFNFKIPDGEHWRRASTCTADHVHIAHSRGFVKIENCLFEYGGDDCEFPYDSGGFSDSDFEFMPDGSIVWFMRTQWFSYTGWEWSPMYFSRSTDGGKTWSKPEKFADVGVLPRLAKLECGITVLCYARPGTFIQASENDSGTKWTKPIVMMTPNDRSGLANVKQTEKAFIDWAGSCNNPEVVAVSKNKALIFYSDFYYPDSDGIKKKTILCREISIEK